MAKEILKNRQKNKRTFGFAWRPFLKRFSHDLLKDIRIREELPAEVIESRWMGYEGAAQKEISKLEKRLGKRLAPSYRSFLAETNGWRNCGFYIYRLWPCSQVSWFRKRHQDWINAYLNVDESDEITDEEYFVYGKRQEFPCFRAQYLQSALEISDVGDSAIMLLNPKVVTADGEWEAWIFANWFPGARRYRSFREMIIAVRNSFKRILKGQGPGKSKYGNEGQQAACRGETDRAIALLKKLSDEGDHASAMSLAELYAVRGLWEQVIPAAGIYLQDPSSVSVNEPFLDMIQLLGLAGHETGKWQHIHEVAAEAIQEELRREYGYFHEFERENAIRRNKILQAYCRRRGRPPHLLRALGLKFSGRRTSKEKLRAFYRKSVRNVHKLRPDLKNKPFQRDMHFFDMALTLRLDKEIIRLFEKHKSLTTFDQALDVSRAYMRRKKPDSAWEVIRTQVHNWFGKYIGQVAPISMLFDEVLRPLMTPERCESILSTPRGWEAKNPWPRMS